MASYASSLLDELMGRHRNANPADKPKESHWSDPEVCKMFLCGFCPHELFVNTRADLGICNKIHDEELTKKYTASSRYMRMGYEEEFLECLQSVIGEVEKKIRRGHQRLALNQAHSNSAGPIGVHQEKLKLLSDRINELIEQAEKLGCEGRIEESQGVLKLCDQLKDERNALQESASNQMTTKEMSVCHICGSFLVVDDIPQRVEEHVSGKQHMGYAKVRDMIEMIKKKMRGEDPEREERLKRERDERDRQKAKERQEREQQTQRRERDHERDYRDNESRDAVSHSHTSRSHGSKRSRSRSRERRHRSRSKERERRRSRERRHRSPDDSHRDRDNGSSSDKVR